MEQESARGLRESPKLHEIGSGCHLLLHFNPDTNVNADLIGYEYKMDSSNPDSNPDTFSI